MAQDMLGKVRALIEKADSTEAKFPAEAALFRAKAEELMLKYRIEEESLIAQDPASVLPILVSVRILQESGGSPFLQEYGSLYAAIASHCGVMVEFDWDKTESGDRWVLVGKTVGYETDVRYAEMIYTASRMVFSERMEPKVNPNLSDQVNAYRLRGSGMERIRVAEALWGSTDRVFLSRVGRLYKAECKARGEEPALDGRGVTGRVYREQYALNFVSTMRVRLYRAGDSASKFGGGLVLHGRKERVEEAFYTHFPSLRPGNSVEKKCEECEKSKHPSGFCKDCRPKTLSQKQVEAQDRRYNSQAAQRGREAGRNAALHVDLRRGYRDGIEQ